MLVSVFAANQSPLKTPTFKRNGVWVPAGDGVSGELLGLRGRGGLFVAVALARLLAISLPERRHFQAKLNLPSHGGGVQTTSIFSPLVVGRRAGG